MKIFSFSLKPCFEIFLHMLSGIAIFFTFDDNRHKFDHRNYPTYLSSPLLIGSVWELHWVMIMRLGLHTVVHNYYYNIVELSLFTKYVVNSMSLMSHNFSMLFVIESLSLYLQLSIYEYLFISFETWFPNISTHAFWNSNFLYRWW